MCGLGGSNSIDDLLPRPVGDWHDANTDWNDDASDGALEERVYAPSGGCQNWRHDVVALVTTGGALRERVRYTAYGIPVGMPHSYGWRDCDGDGDVDAADQSILLGAWGTNTAKCDLNLDGTVDAADNAILLGQLGATAGFGRLSLSGNRFGYAGYASDPAVHADWHVRHRVLMAELGRWSQRESEGATSLYAYASGRAAARVTTDSSTRVSVARSRPGSVLPVWVPLGSDPPFSCAGGSCVRDMLLSSDDDFDAVSVWGLIHIDVAGVKCCVSGGVPDSPHFWELWYVGPLNKAAPLFIPHKFGFSPPPNSCGVVKSDVRRVLVYSGPPTNALGQEYPNVQRGIQPKGITGFGHLCGQRLDMEVNRIHNRIRGPRAFDPGPAASLIGESYYNHHATWSFCCCETPPPSCPKSTSFGCFPANMQGYPN